MPPAALPPGMARYPLYRRLGRPQGRYGRMLKISPPPGFDPPTVQLVASRFTDYAIPAFGGTMQYKAESLILRYRPNICRYHSE